MDISGVNVGDPPEAFREYVLTFLCAGMGKRLMFCSDQMIWPDRVGLAVNAVVSAEFLTLHQKRDILYNNAARFLGIDTIGIVDHSKR